MDIEKALKLLAGRVDEAEIFHLQRRAATLDIKKEDPDLLKESIHSGYGVRAIKDGREGFAYSNTLSEELLEAAVKAGRAAGTDPHVGLPEPGKPKAVPGLYDPELAALEVQDAAEYAHELVEPCGEIGAQATTGGISWSTARVTVANT
ncbi:MAG: hypothetical protein GXO65_02175, partial [Euryarchaeota archaeon]|nr:hypothetical protein [Euryarchaeota archaeon]